MLLNMSLGYDGKGQQLVDQQTNAQECWDSLGRQRLVVEEFMDFSCEVSLIAVRSLKGETSFIP